MQRARSSLRRVRHALVAVLVVAATVSVVVPARAAAAPMVGQVEVDHRWTRVTFPAPMVDPVVVIGPPTRNGTQEVSVRVRAVGPDGFEVRIEEWPSLDGAHADETVAWMAADRGVTTLASGTVLQAGTVTARTSFRTVGLPVDVGAPPIVLVTPLDGDDPRAVAPRVRNVEAASFRVRVQGQEADRDDPDGGHADQPVGWIAFAPAATGATPDDPFPWVVAEADVRHVRQEVPAAATGFAQPCVLGGMQTQAGADTAVLRLWAIVAQGARVALSIEEEGSRDAERGHVRERVALVVVDCDGAGSPPPPPPPDGDHVDHVVHVSIDGLRPDLVQQLGVAELPTLFRLAAEGASTMNARSDADATKTLPNHTSQLTGRPSSGPDGHGVVANQESQVTTIHAEAGHYVASVFDVVHDHGGRTGMYVGKDKFRVIDRSYDATTGAPDVTGADDGRDKIDVHRKTWTGGLVAEWSAEMATDPFTFSLVHVRDPDSAGHASGFGSAAYLEAMRGADGHLAAVLSTIEDDPALAGRTAVVVTSDHGGVGTSHAASDVAENFTTPLWVWAPGHVAAGVDLYERNAATHRDPGSAHSPRDAEPPPIRGHVAGNLALDLLGLPAIPGSVVNADFALAVS